MVQGSLIRRAVDDDLAAGVVIKNGETGSVVGGIGDERVVEYAGVKWYFPFGTDGNLAGIGNGTAVVVRDTSIRAVYADLAAVVLENRRIVHTRAV